MPFACSTSQDRRRAVVRSRGGAGRATGADVVVLGTHGYADDVDPRPSFVALAPDGARHDGLARVDDVDALDLRGATVVVMACRSGAGPVTGEGLLGISRAFLVAGARALPVALWNVGVQTTVELLVEALLEAHARGTGLAEALCATQARFAATHRDGTHQWAGLVLYGAA